MSDTRPAGTRAMGAMASRIRERFVVATTVALTIAVSLVLSDCSLGRERICSKGEHVVKSIEAPATGRTCVRDGEPPPTGYQEYPAGKVPTYTDQGY